MKHRLHWRGGRESPLLFSNFLISRVMVWLQPVGRRVWVPPVMTVVVGKEWREGRGRCQCLGGKSVTTLSGLWLAVGLDLARPARTVLSPATANHSEGVKTLRDLLMRCSQRSPPSNNPSSATQWMMFVIRSGHSVSVIQQHFKIF